MPRKGSLTGEKDSQELIEVDVHNKSEEVVDTALHTDKTMNPSTATALTTEDHSVHTNQPSTEINARITHPTSPPAPTTLCAGQIANPEAVWDPPVTAEMLHELDEKSLEASVQIRHDLALESCLLLKPNSDRRSTSEYKASCDRYWRALGDEIEAFLTDGQYPHRLLRALQEVRKMLLVCYPRSESLKYDLQQYFDMELLSHQLVNRSLPLVPWMRTFAEIIKRNCAPKRDVLVDGLVELAEKGSFTKMMRDMFRLLEIMKLDLANYHLARMKVGNDKVIVQLERIFFNKQYKNGKLKLTETKKWLLEALSTDTELSDDQCLQVYRDAVIRLIGVEETFPETLDLDNHRIQAIRTSLQSLAIGASIVALFKKWTAGRRASDEIYMELRERLIILIEDPKTEITAIVEAVEIVLAHINVHVDGVEEAIDRVAQPNSPLYQTIHSRLMSVMFKSISEHYTTDQVASALKSKRMGMWKEEFMIVYEKARKMANLNWAVYHPVYIAIMRQKM